MTPNLALDLSEDGIVLLHRAPTGSGWLREGEVKFASDDIAAGLAALKARATELEGEDFVTKLILPSSQLLMAELEADQSVEALLAERTPYTPDQLEYAQSGGKVIAVAKETLEEAESFIAPHGLNPLGFTARPEPGSFDGEPMLGRTGLGEERGFEADTAAVNVVEKAVSFLPTPVAPVAETEVDDVAAPASEPVAEEAPKEDAPETTDTPPAEPAVAKDAKAASDANAKAENQEPETTNAAGVPPPPPAPEPSPEPVGGAAFSSRRRGEDSASPAEETGSRVTKLSARIAVPDNAPKLGGAQRRTNGAVPPPPPSAQPETPKVAPAPKASALVTPVVPPAPSKSIQVPLKPAKPQPEADPIAALAAKEQRGKPRFLGLILTVILLVCLGLAAVLSSYILPEDGISGLFRDRDRPSEEHPLVAETDPALIEGIEAESAEDPALETASLAPGFEVDPLESLREQETVVLPPPSPAPESFTEDDAKVAYAATGIWQHVPNVALGSGAAPQTLDSLYVASIDTDPKFEDAPALTPYSANGGEVALVAFTPPPPAGVVFDIDARGLVRATPEGALNPDGVRIIAGRPPIVAQPRPADLAPQIATPEPDNRLAAIRPAPRPDTLIEEQERATLGGLSRAELAQLRPSQRPRTIRLQAEAIAAAVREAEAEALAQAEAEAQAEAQAKAEAEAAAVAATALAVPRSVTPQQRPRNFSRVVAAAQRARQSEPQQTAATAAAAASTASSARRGPAVARASRATPTGRVPATVARAATDANALPLGRVSLVGVFGTSSKRRALVRMPNGRFKKVAVGDRVDGGRVAGIDSNSLRYTKAGRTVVLKMPKG